MRKFKQISVIILAMIIIIVAFQNYQPTETQILFWKPSMPRTLLLFIALLAGFIIGAFVTLFYSKKKK